MTVDNRVHRSKPTKAHDARECAWCHGMLAGAQVATCTSCRTEHHGLCWDQRGGCSQMETCQNAASPAQAQQHRSLSLGVPVAKRPPPPRRPQGTLATKRDDDVAESAPGAFRAAFFGLLGAATLAAQPMLARANAHDARIIRYAIGGVVLVTAPAAILDALKARSALASDDRLSGGAMAIVGMVLALVALGWGFVAVKPLL